MSATLKNIFISLSCFLFCLLPLNAAYPEIGNHQKKGLSSYKDNQNPELVNAVLELEHSVIQQHNISLAQKPKDKPKETQVAKKTSPPAPKEDALQKLSQKNNEINIMLKEKDKQSQDCLVKLNNLEKNNSGMQAKMQKESDLKLEKAKAENTSISQSLKNKTREADDLKKQLDDIKIKLGNIEKEKAGIETKLGQELKDSKEKSGKLQKEKNELEAKLTNLQNSLISLKREKAIIETMLANQPQNMRLPSMIGPESDRLANNKNIHINLGYSYGIVGKIDQAIEQYRAALKYSPDDKDLHYNLAYLLSKQDRNKEAIEEYRLALKGTTQDREIYYNLSIIYSIKLKNQKLGQEYYRKFLDLSSKNSEILPQKKIEISPKG